MVYRGKPSAGCVNCRKSKKRCTLEIPACLRCVKLNKDCSGYRDTTQLQIHDETEAVQVRAEREHARYAVTSKSTPSREAQSPTWMFHPSSTNTDSPGSSNEYNDTLFRTLVTSASSAPQVFTIGNDSRSGAVSIRMPITMIPMVNVEDLATTHFFNQFTSATEWVFLRAYAGKPNLDPCLELSTRACGMAALDNVESVNMGRDYAQSMYVKALGLLNAALRDPRRCTTDESLAAVALLGYYETLTCDSKQSVQSWKAHITGATQLLKLRGKQQLTSSIGRTLFRTTRAQILMHCIWDDVAPASFLWDWQGELERQTPNYHVLKPADELAKLCFNFADCGWKIKNKDVSNVEAAELLADVDRRMIQWSIDTMSSNPLWHYRDVDVQESPHVWNGLVHAYTQPPIPAAWNTYRSIRIHLTRSQEDVCRTFDFSDAEREEQIIYFRRVRRQMTDEICAGIPAQLGHASPAFNTPCVLTSANSAIWPLFFAGNCALERIGSATWVNMHSGSAQTSAAYAQLMWIIGRLEYISKSVGLRFAGGIADVLKGDSRIREDLLADVRTRPYGRATIEEVSPFPELLDWSNRTEQHHLPALSGGVNNTDVCRGGEAF